MLYILIFSADFPWINQLTAEYILLYKNEVVMRMQTGEAPGGRYLNPADINLEPGYRIEVFTSGLNAPINMLFTDEGSLIVAESGVSGNPRILRLTDSGFEVMAEGFNANITGMNYMNGMLYVSHRGFITRITRDGIKQNIISGLPSSGDHYNARVVFGPDRRKIYFGQGTVTNSGVVGPDNDWLWDYPTLCDYPGSYIMLNGQNFETRNPFNEVTQTEEVLTGAFSPYGTPNSPNEIRKGYVKASGSILRSNLDGTMLELYAWGFRNPMNLKFDEGGQLYVANIGYDNRGSRPIANAPDEFYAASQGVWYGWPDYTAGNPVDLPRFTPEGGPAPTLLLKNVPNIPPSPQAIFPTSSNIMGFDFDYYDFGQNYGDVYIAEYGSITRQLSRANIPFAGAGHRVSRIDMKTQTVNTFAINHSGFPSYISNEGGFSRPVDVAFGPDEALYVLDMGNESRSNDSEIIPDTGVIWRISRTA